MGAFGKSAFCDPAEPGRPEGISAGAGTAQSGSLSAGIKNMRDFSIFLYYYKYRRLFRTQAAEQLYGVKPASSPAAHFQAGP